MKANNALLEIGCEEIPARFMPALLHDLKKKAEEKLAASRLTYSKVETLGTPRRLALYIEDLLPKQPDIVEDIQGPGAEIAFKDNHPTPAAEGFARKNGVKVEALSIRTVGNRNFVFAKVKRKGLTADKVLQTLFPEIISSLYMPISMRWRDVDFTFIRPIHWLVALYGSKIVKFELAGIKSGNKTSAHRFFGKNVGTALACPPKPEGRRRVAVRASGQGQALSLQSYKEFLRKKMVMIDQHERKAKIEREVKRTASGALIDKGLLDEVTYLCEYPVAMLGKFDPAFLAIPKDVLITSMKKNQKYFPVLDSNGKLTAQFVFITNGAKGANLAEGNRKVLTARLSDAKFFFEEDKKTPLKMRLPELKKVAFFEKLGSMYEKTERLVKLSEYLAKHLKINEGKLTAIKRIAELSKTDLVTQMVFEFPELQGVMGREYALLEGEDTTVAWGIFEHYLPRSAEDELPKNLEGTVVSIADKLDSLVGCFAIGAIPTGSEDPYGLRRAAYGIVKIILHKKLDLLLDEAVEEAYKLYNFDSKTFEKTFKLLMEFIGGRVKALLLETGLPYDAVDAALANFNDILEAEQLAKTLSENKKAEWFAGIHATANRLVRITKGQGREQIVEADLVDPLEKSLHELYLKVNWDVTEKLNNSNFAQALKELSRFTQPVEEFFQKVLVMHEDPRIRVNRLALLRLIEKTFLEVADFTKIVL